jgi:hypothetical protein
MHADRASTFREELTPRRQELLGWFGRNAPSLHDGYEGALRLLNMPNFPARVHLIAHLVRDIITRLPHILESTTARSPGYKDKLDKIAPLWRAYRSTKADYSGEVAPETSVPEPLPPKLTRELDKLVAAHEEWKRGLKPEERLFRSGLLSDMESPDVLRPMEQQLKKVRRWFDEQAHLRKKMTDPVPENELLRKFEYFEGTLLSIKGQFFKAIGELDEILQDTNA